MSLKDSLSSLSHHAYVLIGGGAVHDELIALLQKTHKIHKQANPDFFDATYETFTIDDARQLKSLAETRPMNEGAKKIFILTMNAITVEAQNALLKLLEEPTGTTHFFLILPSAHLLLPTIKSRVSLIGESGGTKGVSSFSDSELSIFAAKFIASSRAQRLEAIKSFMDEITKEKRPKHDALDLIDALQQAVYSKGLKKDPKVAQALEAIETARTYMYDRGPSLKMLLEYIALAI